MFKKNLYWIKCIVITNIVFLLIPVLVILIVDHNLHAVFSLSGYRNIEYWFTTLLCGTLYGWAIGLLLKENSH